MHYHNNSATGIRIIPNYSFPFQDLENDEFLKTIGSWVYNSEDRLSGKVDLDRDIVVSPDKNDPFKCANDNYIESHYYSVKKSGKIFDDACKQKGFSIFHCNIRSLGKSKSLLHNILSTVKTTPDIIAILESKINENTSANLNIPGYAIVNTNSKCRQEVLVCIYRITWNFQEGVT